MKIDVRAIGPEGTEVGFAKLNQAMSALIGTNLLWYEISDWMGLIPIGVAFCFAVLGASQMVKRRSLLKVDKNLLILGVFYIVVILIYIFFEKFIVNYRPIILNQTPESSYPSSHTMISLCIFLTAIIQFQIYCRKNIIMKRILISVCIVLSSVIVIGRLISGVHWFTDILGGMIISVVLVSAYWTCVKLNQ